MAMNSMIVMMIDVDDVMDQININLILVYPVNGAFFSLFDTYITFYFFCYQFVPIFSIFLSESILSMELCSGPPSLSLPPPADESSSSANADLEVQISP